MAGIVQYVAKHSPKQTEIVAEIRGMILSGEYRPGARLPALAEIQRQFGVSAVTAQRAMAHLCKDGFVSVKEREATRVVENPPHLCDFGFILPTNQHQHFFIALQAESEKLFTRQQSSQRMTLCREWDWEARSKLEAKVQSHALAGLIFTIPPLTFTGSPILTEPGIPRVTVTGKSTEGITAVEVQGLLARGLDYLAARGRRRVAFICSSTLEPESVWREVSAESAARGLATRRHWVQAVNLDMPEWAHNSTKVLFDTAPGDLPDALMIMDDNFVPHATAAIAEMGLQVPDDLDVVAHCNFPYPTPSAVPVKRVGPDMGQLLTTCVDLITRWRRGETVPPTVVLPAWSDDEL